MNTSKLDPKNYCGGKAPVHGGDGYGDFRGDHDASPEYLKEKEGRFNDMMESAPDHIKREIAERQKQQS